MTNVAAFDEIETLSAFTVFIREHACFKLVEFPQNVVSF
jgi:hypothetical protein